MVRITKLTDYGMVIIAFMAEQPSRLFQAQEIAEYTQINSPTVSKLLKKLAKNKILASKRGSNGGYFLAATPEEITVADLVSALEGPIAMTECSLGHALCPTESLCSIRAPWLKINQVIVDTLQSIKLADLVNKAINTNFDYPLQVRGRQHGSH